MHYLFFFPVTSNACEFQPYQLELSVHGTTFDEHSIQVEVPDFCNKEIKIPIYQLTKSNGFKLNDDIEQNFIDSVENKKDFGVLTFTIGKNYLIYSTIGGFVFSKDVEGCMLSDFKDYMPNRSDLTVFYFEKPSEIDVKGYICGDEFRIKFKN